MRIKFNSSAKNIKNWFSTHINIILNIERMFKIKFKVSEIAELKNVENGRSYFKRKKNNLDLYD